jgi:acyl phosphate:glycerol-3-phosphate acyltransferase
MEMFINNYFFLVWMFPLAYLFGSIPTAVWVGRLFHGIDVREHGSGNAGATNVMRVLGIKTGLPVLFFDILKGWGAVFILHFQKSVDQQEELFMGLSILLGVIAVVGHIFPVLAQFRGGKGVATIAGVCLALHFPATFSAFGIFILTLLIFKYVSVASITAGISFPLWIILIYRSPFASLWWFSVVAAMLLLLTHRRNIVGLVRGTESKATFLFRKK